MHGKIFTQFTNLDASHTKIKLSGGLWQLLLAVERAHLKLRPFMELRILEVFFPSRDLNP